MSTSIAPPNTAPLPHVQEVLRTAEHELSELLQQREALMKRIGTLKQLLSGMANLFGDTILNEELRHTLEGRVSARRPGFTRACRQILMDSRGPIQSWQCCEELRRRFPEVALRHKDLGASVTTVFHRLVSYGEARCFVNANGSRVWEWLSENREDVPADSMAGLDLNLRPTA